MKTKIYNPVIFCCLILMFLSCGKEQLIPSEYSEWIKDPKNGMIDTEIAGGFEYTLFYQPVDLKILQAKGENITDEELQQSRDEMKGMEYFMLRIAAVDESDVLKKNLADENEYYLRTDYLSTVMQDDLSLVIDTDTMPCVLYHYEKNYHLYPFINILLAFENSNSENVSDDRVVLLNDRALSGFGIKFRIYGEDINKIPQLKLN